MPKTFLSSIIFTLLAFQYAQAQSSECGDPPALPVKGEASETVKGQLQGQASALSRLVGNAQLGGEVEAARKTLYQSSDGFFAAQKDAYLAYIFCKIVLPDKNMSASDKIKAINEFKRPINASDADGSQMTTTTCTLNSGSMPSGACASWSPWYSLCSELQPTGWRIVSSSFNLSGDRSCGNWAECKNSESSEKRVCHQFRLMGHGDECSRFSSNTGIKNSAGVLQVTWVHAKNIKPNWSDSSCSSR